MLWLLRAQKMSLNYGLDKIRFLAPVPVNSRIRMHSKILEVKEKNPGQFLIKQVGYGARARKTSFYC